jgi:hypothetical protein
MPGKDLGHIDEVYTWHDVVKWLPSDVRKELTMSLPPNLRGWYTEEEAEQDGGTFVEIRTVSEIEGKFIRTGN